MKPSLGARKGGFRFISAISVSKSHLWGQPRHNALFISGNTAPWGVFDTTAHRVTDKIRELRQTIITSNEEFSRCTNSSAKGKTFNFSFSIGNTYFER